MVEITQVVVIRHANSVGKATAEEIVLCMGKNAKGVARTTTSNLYAEVVLVIKKCDSSQSRPRKDHKGKCFHEVNKEKSESMDDLANQVQSLFYHDVHFNLINTRMYTEIDCKMSSTGNVTRQTFKVDAGAEGNLMPISMFANLYAYNNTPIKQFGTCSVRLSFKGKSALKG